MGIDVYCHFIIGVPLSKLGKIETKTEEVDAYNRLGEKNGTVTKRTVDFVCQKFTVRVGDNLRELNDGKRDGWVETNIHKILDDDDQHMLFTNGIDPSSIENFFIGKSIGISSTPHAVEDIHLFTQNDAFYEKAGKIIFEKFGYSGRVYPIAIAEISY